MKRKCFLCYIKTEIVINNIWDLPGLDSCEIGFSICPECGLIVQSPSIDIDSMNKYYINFATYSNPGRKGKSSSEKINDVKRLINTIADYIPIHLRTAFQVGCSDGYTLYAFQQAGVGKVEGIDPGWESHKSAKDLYNIETFVGTFEDFISESKYDLIILTHVLEHLYDPLSVMKKCSSMQLDGRWVLIEVPLFERPDRFPPGLLAFEHLNYFSESTLDRLLYLSGYVPHMIQKSFYTNEYPVLTIIAKKEAAEKIELFTDYIRAKDILTRYVEKEKTTWKRIELKLKQQIKPGKSVYIWGAGIHTSQLLANTDLKRYFHIQGLLDSSPTKWGVNLGNIACQSPDNISLKKGDTILISSYASEQEIYDNLKSFQEKGIDIVKIYGIE